MIINESKRLKEILNLITEVEGRLLFLNQTYTFINDLYGDVPDENNNLWELRKSTLHSERVLKMLENVKDNYNN